MQQERQSHSRQSTHGSDNLLSQMRPFRQARVMLNGSGKPVELVGLRTCRWHGRWCHNRCGDGSFSLLLGCRFIHGTGGLSWVDVGWLVGVVKWLVGVVKLLGRVVVGQQLVTTSNVGDGCHVWYYHVCPIVLIVYESATEIRSEQAVFLETRVSFVNDSFL